jgi:hypothetical protein
MESIECPLTGKKVELLISDTNTSKFCYESYMTGKVCMTDIAFQSCYGLTSHEKEILAGICRNSKIQKEESPLINQKYLQNLNNIDFPSDFLSKKNHFLNYLYNHGGKEYQKFTIDTHEDAPIIYSNSTTLEAIIDQLKEEDSFINYDKKQVTKQKTLFQNIRLTQKGITEIEGKKNYNSIVTINDEIDNIEIKIRETIINILKQNIPINNYELIITGDSKTQVRNRIKLFIEKHPNRKHEDFIELKAAIQFCDIDHLKKLILKDDYWAFFIEKFKDKNKTEKYFEQLTELRHAVKHNREITNLILLEGNAAIEWFNLVF